MTQERDDYMRRQEMDHDLLRQRGPLHVQQFGRGLRAPQPSLPLREEDFRQLAEQMLDVKFGIGREYAHKAIRNDPVTKRIHECAIQLIADLLRVGSASG